MSTTGPTPIPFITEDPRRPSHFIIDPAAATLLKSIKGPIHPIVVAGPYRSGKSTLLNMLLPPSTTSSAQRRSGFAIGSTVQACTKGIWLWGEPVKVGGKTVLLLDSEGLNSIGKEQTFDVQIFSLSILLASLFLLNTTGTISESALEQLELVVQMTERVRAKDSKGNNSSASKEDDLHALSQHFPDFLWILRDFSLQLEDAHGSPITAQQYLQHALQPVPGARSTEKNRIRHVLSTVFPTRDCVPLVRPVTDERQLQRMAALDAKELRPEFRAQMDRLRERVYGQVRPKAVEGMMVTGSAYLSLADAYVRAINGGTVPVIHSAWTAVVELQAKKAMEDARTSFHSDLKQLSTTLHTTAEMTRALDAASVKAHQVLSDNAVGEMEYVDQLRRQLNEWIREEGERSREMNVQRSREHNQRVWAETWKRAKGDSVVEEADDEKAWVELEARVAGEYKKQAKGERMEEIISRQLADRRERMMARVMQRRAEERRQSGELRKELAVRDARVKELEAQLAKLERQIAKLETELESERRSKGEESRRGEEAQRRVEAERTRLLRDVDELRDQVKTAQKQAEGDAKDRRKELQESHTKSITLEAQLRAKDADVRRLSDDLRDADARHRRAEEGSKRVEEQINELRNELRNERKEKEAANDRLKQKEDDLRVAQKKNGELGVSYLEEQKKTGQLERELSAEWGKTSRLQEQLSAVREQLEAARRDLTAEQQRFKQETIMRTDTATKKRKLDDRVEEKDADMVEASDYHEPAPASPGSPAANSFMPPPPRPSMAAAANSRRSLAPTRRSDGAANVSTEPVDPNVLTVQELKSWLTELDVELPMKLLKKDEYVEMVYQALPELEEVYPKKVAAVGKKGKKGK